VLHPADQRVKGYDRLVSRCPALFCVLLAACGPSPVSDAGGDAPSECAGPGTVEVGRGGSRLRALPSSGGELPIVVGAQGGIHVVVGAWVRGLDLDMVMTYRLEDPADGSRVGDETSVPLSAGLFAPDGDRYARHPDLIVLDNDTPRVDDFVERRVLLRVEARSNDGAHACDSREVTLTSP